MDVISALIRTARQQRNATAIIDGKSSLSWNQFVDRVARLASVFRELGLRHGQPVAILSYSSVHVFECFYAVPWAGGMICPLNFRLSSEELAEILHDACIETLIVDDAFAGTAHDLQGRLPKLRNLIHAGEGPTPDGLLSLEALVSKADPLSEWECREEDVACLYYSGGTTGQAKGVMLTHGNVFANALNFAIATGVTDEDRFLHCGPLFHVASGSRVFNAGTFGAASIIMPRFEATQVLEHIERHRITFVSLVPTMLNTLVNLPHFDRYDLSSLRMILYGASPISLPLLEMVIERFKGVELCQAYGQTETAPFATILAPRFHRLNSHSASKLRSVGRPIGSVEVRVVDQNDVDVAAGTVGEVIVRGPNVMKGYFNRPELTAQALRGGWMHSEDLGYLDEDGFLFIVDRIKDMIISGGENIYSVEVENAISSHPAVAECAVFGIPDDKWGEIVHAVIVPRPGQTVEPGMIVDHCRELIGAFKIPRSVQIRTEPLPLSGANKILKTKLREDYLTVRQD